MNNILKICLVIALCAALLMMVGCAKEETAGGESTQQTTQGTTEGTAEATENGSDEEIDQTVTQNPEGDPFDAVTQPTKGENNTGNGGITGNTGNNDKNDNNDNTESTTKPTEPPIGIDDNTEPTEDDFVFDFGDLT